MTRWFAPRGSNAAVAVAALAILALATGAGARPRRAPIRAHGHTFVPVTGDWEGMADGFPASFKLSYEPGFQIPWAVSDLVRMTPSSCPASAFPPNEETINGSGPVPIHSGGSFGVKKYDVYGGATGARTAKLWSNIAYQGAAPASCVTRLTFHMHPAHRRTVDDGTWTLRYSDGGTGTLTVGGGGRIAQMATPQEIDRCYPNSLFPPSGDLALFIGSTGVATVSWGEINLQATLDFAAHTASGQIVIRNQTCSNTSFPMSASLRKPGS